VALECSRVCHHRRHCKQKNRSSNGIASKPGLWWHVHEPWPSSAASSLRTCVCMEQDTVPNCRTIGVTASTNARSLGPARDLAAGWIGLGAQATRRVENCHCHGQPLAQPSHPTYLGRSLKQAYYYQMHMLTCFRARLVVSRYGLPLYSFSTARPAALKKMLPEVGSWWSP